MTYITDIAEAATVLAASDVQLIEFSQNIGQDGGLARMYFDEFESNASGCHEVQRFDSYLVVYGSDVSKTDKHFKKSHLARMRKDDLIDLCCELELSSWDDSTKNDLIDALMDVDHEDYYKAHYASTRYYDLESDFSFNGYSQGDNYQVKTVGKVESWLTSDYLTHIFYDAPLTGTIGVSINGKVVNEIPIYEFVDDEYAYWDKSEFMTKCADYVKDLDYKELLLEFLEADLSSDVKYYD